MKTLLLSFLLFISAVATLDAQETDYDQRYEIPKPPISTMSRAEFKSKFRFHGRTLEETEILLASQDIRSIFPTADDYSDHFLMGNDIKIPTAKKLYYNISPIIKVDRIKKNILEHYDENVLDDSYGDQNLFCFTVVTNQFSMSYNNKPIRTGMHADELAQTGVPLEPYLTNPDRGYHYRSIIYFDEFKIGDDKLNLYFLFDSQKRLLAVDYAFIDGSI